MRARRLLPVLLLVLGLGAGPAAAKPPLWVVRSHGAVVVLFGSIHLLPAGLDWRPPALDDALGKANQIWFELPLTAESDNRAGAASERLGHLPDGASLTGLLPPDEAPKLAAAATRLHCSMRALDQMRPWLAEVTLSVAQDAQSGASAFNGVEDQVQAITPLSVPRRAFETAEQQIGFLADAPMKDQIASLSETLREINDDPASYNRVVGEWMAGDVAGLERDALAPLLKASPVLYERLIAGRNRRWAGIVRGWLTRPGVTVAVVGVGHLVGPDGLPALLRAQGLTVEGP
jgi:uncharacterized protein YbaP (TraB family)